MEDFENPFGITSPRRNQKNKKPKKIVALKKDSSFNQEKIELGQYG